MYLWKQVIYYDFNKNMNMKLLLELIEKCEDSNAEVKAMVCDMGNGTLLSTLDVYQNHNNYFPNPADPSRKVYIVPDVPHCIKNMRNHTMDSGMVIKQSENKLICLSKEHFEDLLSLDNGDFRYCPKLTTGHLYVRGNERQHVRTATELFSETVSKAMEYLLGDRNKDQAKIISTIDQWFDVMNSRAKFNNKNNRCALGKIYFMTL